MKKNSVEWKGEKFPVRTLELPESWGYYSPVDVADVELWNAIEEEYEKDNKKAVAIDNSIFFYCDSDFIASDPTDEKIIDYLQKAGI